MNYYDEEELSLLAKVSRERLLMEHDLGRIKYTILRKEVKAEVVDRKD